MRHLLRLCVAVAPVVALCLAYSSTAVFSSARPAPALAGIVVNSTSDAAANDGLCTLREALTSANADAASGAAAGECAAGSGADTITFSVTGTINLTAALPVLSTPLTISGPGAGQLTVSRDTGSGDYRIFTVNSGVTAAISGLTVANGKAPDGVAGVNAGFGSNGGGIHNSGTLTLTGLTVSGNRSGAGAAGGAVSSFGGGGGAGGGVYNVGTLTMTSSTVSGNFTGAGGDGTNLAGSGGPGGGIFNAGLMTLTDVVVSGNTTGAAGATSGIGGTGGTGGGVFTQTAAATLTRIRVVNNTAGGCGSFPGSSGFGGHGGGLYLRDNTVTLTDSTVSGNTAGACANGTPGYAGGIENGAVLIVSGSTISGNTGNAGGAILNRLSLSLTNSTVSGNNLGAGAGGAINNSDSTSTIKLTNSTITANQGVGVVNTSTPPVVRNTIIAGNNGGGGPDTTGSFNSQGHNIVGAPNFIMGNPGFDAVGDQVGTTDAPLNPRLGPLADNGGLTLTHALLPGSPALDAGNNALAVDNNDVALTTDQRGAGFPRFADSADADTTQTVDIGAFEAHPTVEDIANQATNENTQLVINFNVGDAALGIASVTATSSNAALFPNDAANVSVTGTGPTRTLTLTPSANLSGLATITVTVTATNGRSATDTFQVTVTPVNSAPTLDFLADLNISEDAGTQTVNLSGISAGAGEVQTLSVTATSSDTTLIPHPTVNYTSPSSTGSISFAPAANRSGTVAITVTVTDDGGTAGGGVNTFSRTFNVTVTAVNDAPVNAVPGAQATAQHTPVVFSAANANAISVADIDAGTDAVRVTLTATNGTVTLGSTAGLSFVTGDGADDASVSFSGTINAINAALNGLSFKPAQGFSGAATLQIVTDDQGRNGSGGALSDTDSVTINVAAGGTLQLSAATYQTPEGGLVSTVTVTRTGGSAGAASVSYAISGGTATGGAACGAGVDFINGSGTLNWNDGETAGKSFTVVLCDDPSHESDETVNVTLSGAAGSATLGTPAAAVLTIHDDDPTGGIIQFTQSVHSVAEFAGSVTVTVRRTSDTSQAVSVDYATDDGSIPSVAVPCSSRTGLALDRCDYTKALGTLSFAPGETQKTFKVLITDDSYDEGTETTTLRLSNATGGAQIGFPTATIQITDDLIESAGNPIDDPTKFVTQHYHDFLNREPDAAGLQFWVGGITVCGADAGCREVKRIDTSAAFFLSIEFQETGYLVERTYKAAYGDATSPNVPGTVPVVRLDEFLADTQRIGRDVVVNQGNWQAQLEANKQAYALEFVQRPRFLAAFPAPLTAAEFVERLDQNAGGVLSADERAQLIASLDATPSDAAKRAAALRQVAEHQTLRQREFNRAFVLMQYFGYLRRNPDDAPEPNLNFAGWKFWLDKLEEFGGDYRRAEMVKAFLNSDEYRQRFGPQ